jgi:hypothetical protein
MTMRRGVPPISGSIERRLGNDVLSLVPAAALSSRS